MAHAHLSIDLDAVAENWAALDALSGEGTETAAVVKADGYGLGADRVAARLAGAGVQTFFVAQASEGRAVRQVVGDAADVFVFSGHIEGDHDAFLADNLIPCLNSPEQVACHFSRLRGHPFAVQLDTGMNRLGLETADWDALKSDLMDAGPRLVMSHLACADEPGHHMNQSQLAQFRDMTDGIAHRRSLAATGGTLLGPDYHFDLTRPGVGLYGGLPFEAARPVVRLSAPVIQTRLVRPFESVGYGNTWEAHVESVIATISAGYADGLIRAMGGDAVVWAGSVPCPVVGRVSMDLITVDVTHLNTVPDRLDILSADHGVDAVAEAAGTIGYEILTSLGYRYARRYLGG